MPEIVRFYGIIIKMFFKPKNMSRRIYMPSTTNMWACLI